MNCRRVGLSIAILLCAAQWAIGAEARKLYWLEPMKAVHAQFHGAQGTLAQFGDSITITMAYWAPLADHPKEMSPEMGSAYKFVKSYLKAECWDKWKGAEFGNNGSM